MSDEKPLDDTSAEDLTKAKKPGDIPLNEGELGKVAGGLVLDGIVGESQDSGHKNEIQVLTWPQTQK